MIFVTVGSQKFQFNRLLRKIDELIQTGTIIEPVFAQIGESDYIPQNFAYKAFLDRDEFAEQMKKCELVITHGGTGAIIGAVKLGKKVVAVPRLAKYGEHVDDHQLQLIKQFVDTKLICACYDTELLGEALAAAAQMEVREYQSNTKNILEKIELFL